MKLRDKITYLTKKLKLKDIANIYLKSSCILDFHNYLQHGLTMRTFEVLGSGCKLITTNQNIIKEPFYNESIINIISSENLEFNIDFIKDQNIKCTNIESYSIDKWIHKIFMS